jgi:leucyl-tRNA synthetase
MKFNTCVAFFMEYINFVFEHKKDFGREAIKKFILIFSPFAPHFCEQIWELLGNNSILALQPWPKISQELIIKDKIILVVQVNGKVRDKIEISGGISKDQALEKCQQSERVVQWLRNKEIKEVVYVPDKIINIVVK